MTTKFFIDSEEYALLAGEKVMVYQFEVGKFSSLLLRVESGDVKLTAPGSGKGITFRQSESWSLSADDLKGIPAGESFEVWVRNTSDEVGASVSLYAMGAR